MSFLAHRRTRLIAFLCALALLVCAQEEKRLTVYAPQGAHSVPVQDRDNVEYVSLMAVLQPLGNVSGKADGKKFNVRTDDRNAEFRDGKNKAKIGGKNVDLTAAAEIEPDGLFVPVRGLVPLLTALLDQRVEFREASRRLIVGTPIDFVAEMRANPSRIVLHFSRAVSPKIAGEPGRLRLTFEKEPIVGTEATQNFNDKLIPSATYSETGGMPVLTVSGTAPLMATFGDEGKTITVAAAPQAAEKPQAPLQPPVAPPAAAPGVATAPAGNAAAAPARPRFVVVIDPAHGGDDRGAVLEAGFNEKDLTLTIARKLRAALDRAGIPALLLRDGDTALSADDRAAAANTARAAMYVGVHAGNVGRGVRIYTARMGANPQSPGTMAAWNSAQAAYLDRSRELADGIAASLAHASVDHAEGTAPLQPLPHLTSAAVELEVLPDKSGIASLQSADYQQRICAAVAEAIAASRRTQEARK